jgi:hypothetical protein
MAQHVCRSAPVAQGIERLPPEQKAAGSNPAGGTEKFAGHMAFIRDIQTHCAIHVPSAEAIVGSSARRCVLEGTFQFGAAMLRSSLTPSPWLVWSCRESNLPQKSP